MRSKRLLTERKVRLARPSLTDCVGGRASKCVGGWGGLGEFCRSRARVGWAERASAPAHPRSHNRTCKPAGPLPPHLLGCGEGSVAAILAARRPRHAAVGAASLAHAANAVAQRIERGARREGALQVGGAGGAAHAEARGRRRLLRLLRRAQVDGACGAGRRGEQGSQHSAWSTLASTRAAPSCTGGTPCLRQPREAARPTHPPTHLQQVSSRA